MPHIQRPSSIDDRSVAVATFTIEASLVLLNILPLLTALVVKKERRSTDELIAALSVNDILGVLLPLPARLITFIKREWIGGRIACQLYQLSIHWTQLNGMCLLTLICIDRFLSVRYSIERKTPYSNGKLRFLAILISFATLFISCLPLMGLAPVAFQSKLCRSWLIAEASTGVQRVFYAVFIAVASSNLLVAFACNAKTVRDVYSMKDSLTDQRQVAEFSLLIAVVTIVFYLAWLPVLVIIPMSQAGYQVGRVAIIYCLISPTLTGMTNPILYAICSSTYRKCYTAILGKICKVIIGCTPKSCRTEEESTATTASTTANSVTALLESRTANDCLLEGRLGIAAQYNILKGSKLSLLSSEEDERM